MTINMLSGLLTGVSISFLAVLFFSMDIFEFVVVFGLACAIAGFIQGRLLPRDH